MTRSLQTVHKLLEADVDAENDPIKDFILSQPRDIGQTEGWDELNWLAFVTKTKTDDWDFVDQEEGAIVYGYLPTAADNHFEKTARVSWDTSEQGSTHWKIEVAENEFDDYTPVFNGSYTKLLKMYQQ